MLGGFRLVDIIFITIRQIDKMGYSDLIWGLVRNNNAFIVKNQLHAKGTLTTDPLSATGRHTLKNSGLAADSAVGISGRKKGGLKILVTKPRVWKNKGKNGFKNFNFSKFIASGSGAAKVNDILIFLTNVGLSAQQVVG